MNVALNSGAAKARHPGLATLPLASLAATPVLTSQVLAQSSIPSPSRRQAGKKKRRRIAIQEGKNNRKIMNLVLTDAENLAKLYEPSGKTVRIGIVAYGPGLGMVRNDNSPAKDRFAVLVRRSQQIMFASHSNMIGLQSKQEGEEISLSPEAHLAPTSIGNVVQL